jgi:hypothetical protein
MANGKKPKASGKKRVKDLGLKDAKTVVGGVRKAGGEQQEYMVVKLNDVTISS